MNIIAQLSTAIRRASASSPDIIYNDAKLHRFSTHKKPDKAGCSTSLAAAFKPEALPIECNIPCDSMVYGDFPDIGLNFFVEVLSTHTPIREGSPKRLNPSNNLVRFLRLFFVVGLCFNNPGVRWRFNTHMDNTLVRTQYNNLNILINPKRLTRITSQYRGAYFFFVMATGFLWIIIRATASK